MPLHVVAGFFESDRGIRDSGVRGMKGMAGPRGVSNKADGLDVARIRRMLVPWDAMKKFEASSLIERSNTQTNMTSIHHVYSDTFGGQEATQSQRWLGWWELSRRKDAKRARREVT